MRLLDWIFLALILGCVIWIGILTVSIQVLGGLVQRLYTEIDGVQK